MKQLTLIVSLLAIMSVCRAQTGDLPPLDKSPMDMCYFPNNYPVLKIQGKVTEPVSARIIYSRPQKNGRIIFGDLVEYGKVWRLGANEATEIEFLRNVKIDGKKVTRGVILCMRFPIPTTGQLYLIKTSIFGARLNTMPKKMCCG